MNRINEIADFAEVSEKSIERYLVKKVEEIGGLCLKYANPYEVGYPDRLVILPGRPAFWVEVKSRGKKPRRIQTIRHQALRERGQVVYVIDDKEQVDLVLINERS